MILPFDLCCSPGRSLAYTQHMTLTGGRGDVRVDGKMHDVKSLLVNACHFFVCIVPSIFRQKT